MKNLYEAMHAPLLSDPSENVDATDYRALAQQLAQALYHAVDSFDTDGIEPADDLIAALDAAYKAGLIV